QYWNGGWGWTRGYVYVGGQLLAIQSGGVRWVHQDPVTKSQRVTDASGAVTPTQVDLDPWGGETTRSTNTSAQPQRYTTYTRDENGGDEAMMRRYSGTQQRFSQPLIDTALVIIWFTTFWGFILYAWAHYSII
ncbi:MAG TPA: hypothetical protein VEZ40_04385, partial [Pyrinomonadaceae bacterium]|nr:hypothetical protein [Pyrinomonadaceae bacterium]